jgi:hypothetical protein
MCSVADLAQYMWIDTICGMHWLLLAEEDKKRG